MSTGRMFAIEGHFSDADLGQRFGPEKIPPPGYPPTVNRSTANMPNTWLSRQFWLHEAVDSNNAGSNVEPGFTHRLQNRFGQPRGSTVMRNARDDGLAVRHRLAISLNPIAMPQPNLANLDQFRGQRQQIVELSRVLKMHVHFGDDQKDARVFEIPIANTGVTQHFDAAHLEIHRIVRVVYPTLAIGVVVLNAKRQFMGCQRFWLFGQFESSITKTRCLMNRHTINIIAINTNMTAASMSKKSPSKRSCGANRSLYAASQNNTVKTVPAQR